MRDLEVSFGLKLDVLRLNRKYGVAVPGQPGAG